MSWDVIDPNRLAFLARLALERQRGRAEDAAKRSASVRSAWSRARGRGLAAIPLLVALGGLEGEPPGQEKVPARSPA